ncbi:MAG: molybdopterin-dependent oxidoreductase [Nitrospinae bacterium]|nr:molybdopterin-dependent oxidoreductase [Nitrospinota bacterium]
MQKLERRKFLKLSAAAAAGIILSGIVRDSLAALSPVVDIKNPLAYYPDKDWEKAYHDQYKADLSFKFLCAPNDTHNCRLSAFVRNGVITRMEQAYDVDQADDLYGNKATQTWHPRGCPRGLAYMRRSNGPFRVKYPAVRKGWKEWYEAGFPRDHANGRPPAKFMNRGTDDFARVTWDEVYEMIAKALLDIASTYSGKSGAGFLLKQGYPEEMLQGMKDKDGGIAGVRALKFRGGMALLGVTRLAGLYRLGNSMVLLDDYIRKKGPDASAGATLWDNYAWHTDLPPGQPMVHGAQTFDQEFHDFWNSDLIIISGLNIVENKMADPVWWQTHMEKKKKIVVIAPEYNPTASKSDYWIPIRYGCDAALNLALSHVIIKEGLWDDAYVKKFTNQPFLIRMDNLKQLRFEDMAPGTPLLDPGDVLSIERLGGHKDTLGTIDGKIQSIEPEFQTNSVMMAKKGPVALTRTCCGDYVDSELKKLGMELGDIQLDYSGEARTKSGPVKVRTVFSLYKELLEEYTPEIVERAAWCPAEKIRRLAKDIAESKAVSFICGMGMNMYLHNDLINRSYYLTATLTGNIGKPGACVSSYAGNYKAPTFNGLPSWIMEDPFNQTLDPDADGTEIKKRKYARFESQHYWAHGDRPLIVQTPKAGRVVVTGSTHMPAPTKMIWSNNANQIGNSKWAYDVIKRSLPEQELLIATDFDWNMNCEYSDIVLATEDWSSFSHPDMTASCTNPFLQFWPVSPLKSMYDTRHDIEHYLGVGEALARITGDARFSNHYKFVKEKKVDVYMQRILDASTQFRGYKARDLIERGVGVLAMFRTYPRIPAWENINESVPFFTRTGRMELYREENTWINQGENLILHREPVEATLFQTNVIISPKGFEGVRPRDYGIPDDEIDGDAKTLYNKIFQWDSLLRTTNPLTRKHGLNLHFITPKPRHRAHSSWGASDWNVIWCSNFGDPYRMETRTPWVGEEEMDINPEDAKELGIKDGDWVWVDANPEDRPYVGMKKDDPYYKVSRAMIRVHYNPSFPKGMLNVKHGAYGATHKSVEAHETHGIAITGRAAGSYAAAFRYGSHQSAVRTYLNPTQSGDEFALKDYFENKMTKGYSMDMYTVTGAPKESLVKIAFAEHGGLDRKTAWEPAKTGFTPGNLNEDMKGFVAGGFIIFKS